MSWGRNDMSQAPSMPVFTDALIGDTTHLSAEEFGCYCLLLFATWRNNGQPFEDGDRRLCRICRVSERRWRAVIRPVLVEFFDLSDGRWRQKRLEKEWKFVSKSVEIRRANGRLGGRPKSLNNREIGNLLGSAQANLEQTGRLSTHTHTQSHNKKEARAGARNAGWRPNGRGDPWGLAGLSEDDLMRRFNDKTASREEHEAVGHILFPNAFPH